MSVLLFTSKITPRLQYVAAFVSNTFFDKQLQITDNFAHYQSHDGLAINYSAHKILPSELHLQPVDLLFEKNIAQQNIGCFDWQGLKVFFRTGGDISFDIFAATFYLISRYEEYLPHAKDEFGRYAHINSLAFREHFLDLPLVNMWWNKLLQLLSKKLQYTPAPSPNTFQFIPTYDVDIAFNYKARGFKRTIAAIAKDMYGMKISALNERIDVLAGKKKDPYDTFEWLDALHEKHRLNPVYFFLLAEKNKGYDKNNAIHAPAMKLLCTRLANRYEAGIHPSWQSSKSFDILLKEIKVLHHITGNRIAHSRQHYIKMTLPQTYRLLIDAGILHEYSMGYGSINGFRASVASPFYWFDLEQNKATHLLVHPFCYMDANAIFEQQLTVQQAAHELEQYCSIVKKERGTFITIFHNHFLTRQREWAPWRDMYAAFLSKHFA